MNHLTPEQLEAMSNDELIAQNQSLMAEKDAITTEQLKVKSELNSRASLAKFNAMTPAEREAIAQHVRAGGINATTGK